MNLTRAPTKYQALRKIARRSNSYKGWLVYQEAGNVRGGEEVIFVVFVTVEVYPSQGFGLIIDASRSDLQRAQQTLRYSTSSLSRIPKRAIESEDSMTC